MRTAEKGFNKEKLFHFIYVPLFEQYDGYNSHSAALFCIPSAFKEIFLHFSLHFVYTKLNFTVYFGTRFQFSLNDSVATLLGKACDHDVVYLSFFVISCLFCSHYFKFKLFGSLVWFHDIKKLQLSSLLT